MTRLLICTSTNASERKDEVKNAARGAELQHHMLYVRIFYSRIPHYWLTSAELGVLNDLTCAYCRILVLETPAHQGKFMGM
jgi:hypothetical protein